MPCRVIPKANCLIIATTHQPVPPTLGVKAHRAHAMSVTKQNADRFARLHTPEMDSCVFAATGQPLPIRAKSHRPNAIFMTSENTALPPTGHLPHTHRTVVAATDQQLPIGSKGQRAHLIAVPLQHM